jgi:hypothetical protein
MALGAVPVLAGSGHISGPLIVTVDGNPATVEQITFEVIADGSTAEEVYGFEWQLGVTGSGLSFNVAYTKSLTDALITDPAHFPAYLLYGDSFIFDAALSDKGIRGSDVSNNSLTYAPAGKSLGLVVLTVTDEVAALGIHQIQDPESFFVLGDFESIEGLDIPSFQFEVVPEPATLAILALGGLAVLRRRKNA